MRHQVSLRIEKTDHDYIYTASQEQGCSLNAFINKIIKKEVEWLKACKRWKSARQVYQDAVEKIPYVEEAHIKVTQDQPDYASILVITNIHCKVKHWQEMASISANVSKAIEPLWFFIEDYIHKDNKPEWQSELEGYEQFYRRPPCPIQKPS